MAIKQDPAVSFGIYFAIYGGIFLLSYILDKRGVCDKTVERLAIAGNCIFVKFKEYRKNKKIEDGVEEGKEGKVNTKK